MDKKWRWVFLLGLVLLLIAGISLFLFDADTDEPILAAVINLEPLEQGIAGIALDTKFVLKSDVELDAKAVEKNLAVEPELAFLVEKGQVAGELLIVPSKALEPNRVYRFSFRGGNRNSFEWAFQTKGDFRVVSALPRNRSSNVPVNTGVEVSFSHLNVELLPDYWETSPKVEGRFEIHKKTVVFVPKKLEPSTIYTVRIKKGLPLSGTTETLKEDFVLQFETESSPDSQQNNFVYFQETEGEYATWEKPILPVNIYWRTNQQEKLDNAKVKVYGYASSEEYIKARLRKEEIPSWAYLAKQFYWEDSSSLNVVAQFDTPIVGTAYNGFLEFPEAFPQGFYLAEVEIEGEKKQFWFQCTDLSAYTAVADEEILFWVNDLKEQKPVKDAGITLFDRDISLKTGDGGLAVYTLPRGAESFKYALINSNGMELAVSLLPKNFWQSDTQMDQKLRQHFWKYLYLNRELFKPTDTIHFWGVLSPRDAGFNSPEELSVRIIKRFDEPPIIEEKIPLKGFTFDGEIKLLNLNPGYYQIEVVSGEHFFLSKGFKVENYTKPAYDITVEADKKAVFAGETINFKVNASFFEGTPAGGISITGVDYSLANPKRVSKKLDLKGEAVFSFNPPYRYDGGDKDNRGFYFNAELPEAGVISEYKNVLVFNNDIGIKAKSKAEADGARVSLDLHQWELDGVNRGEVDIWDYEKMIGEPVSAYQVEWAFYENVWEQEEVGEYYNFINKTVQKKYRYNHYLIQLDLGEFVTDAQGHGELLFPLEKGKSYQLFLRTVDLKGKKVEKVVHLQQENFNPTYRSDWYQLVPPGQKASYQVGEKVEMAMQNDGVICPERPEGYLFMEGRAGIINSRIQGDGTYTTIFAKEMIPNLWIRSVYFDGRLYHEAWPTLARFDQKEKALKVEVRLDKEEYQPGDLVELEIEVKDSEGKPVSAQVNINLVDEALFALMNQNIDPLNDIYYDFLLEGIIKTYQSHRNLSDNFGGAEMGGEGGGERKDFKDAVYFASLSTNKQGIAKTSFKLSDDLTTWRLTYHAVTAKMEVAGGKLPVKVKLPFFVDLILNQQYLAGDRPQVGIRTFGTQLEEQEQVSLDAKLTDPNDGVLMEKSLDGKAFNQNWLQLPVLEAGNYQLRVGGKTKSGLQDALILPVNVVETMISREERQYALLDAEFVLPQEVEGLTTLTFSDHQKGQYLDLLSRLAWVSGSRVEQQIAAFLASNWLKEYFPQYVFYQERQFNPWDYQLEEDGIAILPYGDGELEQSAKLALLAPEYFDQGNLVNYFMKVANDPRETRERTINSLFGLAALGEPVLNELDFFAKEQKLSTKEKLYLALGYGALGAKQKALPLWEDIKKASGETIGKTFRLKDGADKDDVLELTALGAMLAGLLDVSEQYSLMAYLQGSSSKEILTYLEQLYYLKMALGRMNSEEVSFAYWIDNRKESITLKPEEIYNLRLAEENLSKIRFEDIKGQIGVLVSYQGKGAVQENFKRDSSALGRKYLVNDKGTNAFAIGDLVKIRIDYNTGGLAPDGYYRVVDFLPAGLKPTTLPEYGSYRWRALNTRLFRPIEVDRQKAVFMVPGGKHDYFYYYARIVNLGDFSAEAAIMEHLSSGEIFATTNKVRVQIR